MTELPAIVLYIDDEKTMPELADFFIKVVNENPMHEICGIYPLEDKMPGYCLEINIRIMEEYDQPH